MAKNAAQLLRPSLRANVVLMVLGMLVLPQIIVVAWSAMERDIGGKLQWSAKAAATEAAEALASAELQGLDGAATERRLLEVAERYTSRIRVVSEDGTESFDADRDQGTDLVHQIGTLFFGPDGAPTLREYDETLVAVHKRPEVVKAGGFVGPAAPAPRPLTEGTARPYPSSTAFGSALASSMEPPMPDAVVETGCRTSPAGKLLVCHAARAVATQTGSNVRRVVYVQESSRRAVRALYDLRYHLARLSIVMLPLALVFSWWMGRRMTRPIDWLRTRVLEKAKAASPHADLVPYRGDHRDEVGELANAFNDLLGALDERRRANEAVAADLVHEFKNPVAAIRACAESLESGAVDEKRAARLARILADSSERLDVLVSQFLELARAEAGMPNEERTHVDMARLARGVATSLEASYPKVRFEVEGAERTTVYGVAPRLDSLVRNLVDNAGSFATDLVRVAVKREEIAGGAARIVLEVSDDGPGIAEENLSRVFDRFFTTRALPTDAAEAASKPKRRGSGLGLALVKAVAEAHEGEVSARTTRDKAAGLPGTTFRVVLPAER